VEAKTLALARNARLFFAPSFMPVSGLDARKLVDVRISMAPEVDNLPALEISDVDGGSRFHYAS
jgi:hypothetical protein